MTITITVFSILSLHTTPVRVFRFPLSLIGIPKKSLQEISPPLVGGDEGEGEVKFIVHPHPLPLPSRERVKSSLSFIQSLLFEDRLQPCDILFYLRDSHHVV